MQPSTPLTYRIAHHVGTEHLYCFDTCPVMFSFSPSFKNSLDIEKLCVNVIKSITRCRRISGRDSMRITPQSGNRCSNEKVKERTQQLYYIFRKQLLCICY